MLVRRISISRLFLLSSIAVLLVANAAPGWAADSAEPGGTKTGPKPQGLNVFNHIIFMAQENRSFDQYFGELRQYWAQNGYADESFDGLPQFNPVQGAPPLQGPPPQNFGCDPAYPPPRNCVVDSNSPPVASFQLITQCTTNTYSDWNEAHEDWDIKDPTGKRPAKLNGFVREAADVARWLKYDDSAGERAMGYYEDDVLNYYYFMASNFATSDRWFHPLLARTGPNREYMIAGTSQGDVYPVGSNKKDVQLLTATTIFQELQAAGISWKIYINPVGTGCSGPPYQPSCLLQTSYVRYFQWGQSIPTMYPNNLGTIGVPDSDWDNDVKNGTLPAVSEIEPATDAGLDEHPSETSPSRVQLGAQYVSSIINQIMFSPLWTDSVFILTYDENGGLYDHVSPHAAVSPDGIKPQDLKPTSVCYYNKGPLCDFTHTGYRAPLIVVSPYTKEHYVSHTVSDHTAILKLIEKRFNLPPLTKRDAAQADMSEFFDFTNPPWMTPPNPPTQRTDAPCYLDHLP